jgi:hypothetical protein
MVGENDGPTDHGVRTISQPMDGDGTMSWLGSIGGKH